MLHPPHGMGSICTLNDRSSGRLTVSSGTISFPSKCALKLIILKSFGKNDAKCQKTMPADHRQRFPGFANL